MFQCDAFQQSAFQAICDELPHFDAHVADGGGRYRKRKPELPPEFRPPKLVLVEKVQEQDVVIQILPAPAVVRNPVLADALRRARAGKEWTPAKAVPESVIAALNKPIPILAKKKAAIAGKALTVEDDDNEILYLMYG